MGLPIPCQSPRFAGLKRLAIEPIFHLYLGEGGLIIKFLAPSLARDPSVRTRFFSVAEKMTKVSHENVVPVIDFGEEEGTPYLVTPLILGKRLDNILARSRGVSLPSKAALRIVEQLSAALSWAREVGVDPAGLTREKVLVTFDGTVKLIDVGFSSLLKPARKESDVDLVRSLLGPFDDPALVQALQESAEPLGEHMKTFFSGDLAWQERMRPQGSPSSLPDSAPLLPVPLPPRLPAPPGEALPRRRFRKALAGITVVAVSALLALGLFLRKEVVVPLIDPAVEPKIETPVEAEPAKLEPPTPEPTIGAAREEIEPKISPPQKAPTFRPISVKPPPQAPPEEPLPIPAAIPSTVTPEPLPPPPSAASPVPPASSLPTPASPAPAPPLSPAPPPPESEPASSAPAVEEPRPVSPEEGIHRLLDRLKTAYRTGDAAAYLSNFAAPDPLLESEFLAVYREAKELRVSFHIFETTLKEDSAEISLLQTMEVARKDGKKVRLRELQLLVAGAESGEWKVRKKIVVERYAPEGAT